MLTACAAPKTTKKPTARWTKALSDSRKPEFVKKVNHDVDAALQKAVKAWKYDEPVKEGATKSHTLEDLLGPEHAKSWWRLYIDTKDWEDALRDHGNDPGIVYDEQQSPGWQTDLIAVYQRFLNPHSKEYVLGEKLTWKKYNQIWEEATEHVGVTAKEIFVSRFGADQRTGEYGTSNGMAMDTKNEMINGRYLIRTAGDHRFDEKGVPTDIPDPAKTPIGYAKADAKHLTPFLFHWNTPTRVEGATNGEILQEAVDAVFAYFHDSISQAKTRGQQLETIARTIRFLHMLHTWTDGCGRVNVQTLLPAMLMKYGFGLPLGGQFGQQIDPWAGTWMFNGGYSVQQMAKFLFVMQDYGLKDPEHSVIKGQQPATKAEHPVTNAQHPAKNTQHPSMNAQRSSARSEYKL